MTADKKLIPTNMVVSIGSRILDDIQGNNYYIYVGNNRDADGAASVQPYDDIREVHHDAYNHMLFGKRIAANTDVRLMIRNVPYQSGVLDMYDDQDSTISTKDFYAVVNADAFYHIFKCLDNNMGANSTVTPNFTHISGANTQFYQTSDGYKWKYMYSISDTTYARFATTEYIPVEANTTVSNSAVDGSIDNIIIEDTGRGYDNHLQGTFSTGTLRIGGNNRVFMVTNSAASVSNHFYTRCMLSIVGGTGIGQHKTISSYFVNSTGKYVVSNSEFTTALAVDSQYEITPGVEVLGDHEVTTNAIARALINSSASNSVHRIEIIDRGAAYKTANAFVTTHPSVGVFSEAVIRPIIAPPGGHGANAATELYCKHLAVTARLSNTEANTIPATNGFRQIGLIKNPKFYNVQFTIEDVEGTFVSGERALRINPIKFQQNVTISDADTEVTANTGLFDQLDANTYLYITNQAMDEHMIGVINSINSNTSLELTQNALFSCTQSVMFLANVSCGITVSNLVSPTVFLSSNVEPKFHVGDTIVGLNSGAKATINAIHRSGESKDFNTFIQMYKYLGDQLSGTFEADETVSQGNTALANGVFHSITEDDGVYTLYVSDQNGLFNIVADANTITGEDSEAVLGITDKYLPELHHGSGHVIYMINIDKQTRQADQTELIRLIYEFA